MKKLFLCLFIIFLVVSCDIKEYYSVLITNDSSKTVSYVYNGNLDTLNMSESKTYSVKAYTQAPKNIIDQNGISSLNMTRHNSKDEFAFTDATPLGLNVINSLPIEVKMKADNFIDDNGTPILIIEANGTKNAWIFTSKPIFESLINQPIIFDWNLSENNISLIIK